MNKKILTGSLIGLVLPILLALTFFEHPFSIIVIIYLLPISLILMIVGGILGIFNFIPVFKYRTIIILFLGLLIISATIFIIKYEYIRMQRELIANKVIPNLQESTEISRRYSDGDGFDNEPVLTIRYQTKVSSEDVQKNFDSEMQKMGWINRSKPLGLSDYSYSQSRFFPQYGDYYVMLEANPLEVDSWDGKLTHYTVYLKFWGTWMNDIRYAKLLKLK